MNRQAKHLLLTLLNLSVWSSVVLVGSGKVKLFAKSTMAVSINATPAAVRISIDGKKWENGQYLESPIALSIPAGKRKLKISRDGFVTHIVTIEGQANESMTLDDVTLQPLQSANFTAVDVVQKDKAPILHGDIDDGISRGELPFKAMDIQADVPHNLSIYPDWPKKTPRLRCRFIAPQSTDPELPFRIEVQIKGGRLKASGCQPQRADSTNKKAD